MESMDAFRRIVHALRSSHRAAADLDLTGAQLFVLATLGAAGGPMGVTAPMLFDENAGEQTKARHRRSATKKARTRAVRR
jgi:hypothetical protein